MEFANVLLRTQEAKEGSDRVTRVDAVDVGVQVTRVPVAAVIVELRAIVIEGRTRPTTFGGREEVNLGLNIVRDSHHGPNV
jgi:hypothetical protein